jgi:hypothetical protein
VAQPTSALVVVPYPPPPARVEIVPPPVEGAVWLDGEWDWQGASFAWRRGRWVKPPPGARYSPWTTVRGEDGTVYFAPGVWRDSSARPVADPPPRATAKSASNPVVDPEGHLEITGHTIHEPQAPSPAVTDAGASDAAAAPAVRDD